MINPYRAVMIEPMTAIMELIKFTFQWCFEMPLDMFQDLGDGLQAIKNKEYHLLILHADWDSYPGSIPSDLGLPKIRTKVFAKDLLPLLRTMELRDWRTDLRTVPVIIYSARAYRLPMETILSVYQPISFVTKPASSQEFAEATAKIMGAAYGEECRKYLDGCLKKSFPSTNIAN